jgi:RND family efflux transporter MFP subunit
MIRLRALSAAVLLAAGPALAEGAALVQTVQPRRGVEPRTVAAYGSAAPSALAVHDLTLPQGGQVTTVQVVQGQAVKKGQTLLTFATAPSTVASYRQARTAVELAQAQRLHAVQLLAQQLATRDQLATADKALADARAQLAALAREGASRASVTIVAPSDGVVVATPVSAGDRPAAGAPLMTLSQSGGVQVSLGLQPAERSLIRYGQPVRLEPLGGGPEVTGRVIRVDSVLNPRSRLVDVDVYAPPGQALSGQAFRGVINVGELAGWRVPHEAVRVEEGRAFVFQIAGGKAHRVDVRVLQPGREIDLVDGPIESARPLVTAGAYQLVDGDAVRTR